MREETAPAPAIRVLIADDHEIVREGLRTLLGEEPDLLLVGEASDGAEAVRLTADLTPDVLLLDLLMPGVGGLEALQRLQAAGTATRVLVLTTYAEPGAVREAVHAGAAGYLLKDVSRQDLVRAIRDAHGGRPALHPEAQRLLMKSLAEERQAPVEELTPRERQILELITRGRSNKQIAGALHLSEGTVKGYVSIVLAKLGVEDRTQAALYAVRHRMVQLEDL
jgi:DNA-binding NarL/FixJ family response regulator